MEVAHWVLRIRSKVPDMREQDGMDGPRFHWSWTFYCPRLRGVRFFSCLHKADRSWSISDHSDAHERWLIIVCEE